MEEVEQKPSKKGAERLVKNLKKQAEKYRQKSIKRKEL
jgi:hypothetical protein